MLDAVGITLIAQQPTFHSDTTVDILKNTPFITLHEKTLYNYSGAYDGDQLKTQFRSLCPKLSDTSEKTGILMVEVNPDTHALGDVLGALCPSEQSGNVGLHPVSSQWQKP